MCSLSSQYACCFVGKRFSQGPLTESLRRIYREFALEISERFMSTHVCTLCSWALCGPIMFEIIFWQFTIWALKFERRRSLKLLMATDDMAFAGQFAFCGADEALIDDDFPCRSDIKCLSLKFLNSSVFIVKFNCITLIRFKNGETSISSPFVISCFLDAIALSSPFI